MFLSACGTVPPVSSDAPAARPAPSTPIPQGVFRGRVDCERVSVTAEGTVSEEWSLPVTLDFSERGVPVVAGQEIAVAGPVTIGGLSGTYTRIDPTKTGMVIHGESDSGNSITEIATRENGVDYWVQVTEVLDGSTVTNSCFGFLE